MPMCHVIVPPVACPILPYFSTLFHTGHDFREKVIEYKMCVGIFSATFVWNIYHSTEKWARYDYKLQGLHMYYSFFLADFNKILIVCTDFRQVFK